jgi:hypothetical protein
MIGFVDEIESGERMGMGPMGQGNLVPPPLPTTNYKEHLKNVIFMHII